jgi:hypothetical protein
MLIKLALVWAVLVLIARAILDWLAACIVEIVPLESRHRTTRERTVMTNEQRKAALLARWNAPESRLAIRTLCQMDNVCAYYKL